MKISFELKLLPEEETQLAGILNTDSAKLSAKLAPFASAATAEYVRMFLGQRVFTRGSDLREYRLLLLIQTAFENAIPSEDVVSSLLQCTRTQSRALLRSVMSKYQYELRSAIETTLIQSLKSVKRHKNDNVLRVVVFNENIIAELNKVLSILDGTEDQIVRQQGKLAVYEFTESAYKALCKKYNIQPVP